MNALTPVALRGASALDRAAPHWSGRPGVWAAARRVWRLPWVALWFALLAADGARIALSGPHAPPRAWEGEGHLLMASAAALLGLFALSWLTARTTRYEVDHRALTLRYGVALPATLVIPFAAIESVAARTHRDGSGDVALRLRPGQGVNYLKLWPHARPGRLLRAEPMLRGLPDAGVAAALLCREVARAHDLRAATGVGVQDGLRLAAGGGAASGVDFAGAASGL